MAKRELKFEKQKDGITVRMMEGGEEKGRLSKLPSYDEASRAALSEWGHVPTIQMEAVTTSKVTQPKVKKASLPPPAKSEKPETRRTAPPKKTAKVWSMHPPTNGYCPEQRAQIRTVRKGVEKD
jgi:hypothetical protein